MAEPSEEPWVDPQMRDAMARSAKIAQEQGLAPDRSVLTPAEARTRMELDREWWNRDRPELARVVDTAVPTATGEVPVRLLYPTVAGPLPTIVYMHGGGWVVGSLETHARAMHYLALASGCLVAAVDYSLAPETRFPGALEEIAEVVRHVVRAPQSWNADPDRIALAGDSAGANLAAGAGIMLRDADPGRIKALGLVYPVAGDNFETESYRTLSRWGLTTADMRTYFGHYLGRPEDWDDPRAVPLKADLAGLPPTFLYAAALDVLRDDSVEFDRRLRAAGVPGDLTVYDGVIHGFMTLTRTVGAAHRMTVKLATDLSFTLDGVSR